MKILICGAGVIGQIYAARLHQAGHDVTVLARHRTLETLARDGITLVNGALVNGATSGPVRVNVTGHVGPDSSFELALVTVRRDQVDEILPALADLRASHFVTHRFALDEFEKAYDVFARPADTGALKVVLSRSASCRVPVPLMTRSRPPAAHGGERSGVLTTATVPGIAGAAADTRIPVWLNRSTGGGWPHGPGLGPAGLPAADAAIYREPRAHHPGLVRVFPLSRGGRSALVCPSSRPYRQSD